MYHSIYAILALAACVSLGCGSIPRQAPTDSSAPTFIGTKDYRWADTTRRDDYYGGSRIVNARVWYPSEATTGDCPRTPYLAFGEQLDQRLPGWSASDYESVGRIQTRSRVEAPHSKDLDQAPLLLFSPSLGGNLSYYTYYAEYFAERGYVVLGINHLYESEAVVDGRANVYPANLRFHDSLKTLKIPEEISAEGYRAVKGVRQRVLGGDVIFALDRLLAEEDLGRRIDTNQIAAFGHSIGGAAAVYAALLDWRVKAVIDLDGTPPSVALNQGIDVPFLFIEDLTDYRNHPGYAKLHQRRNAFCALNRADAWRVLIGGFNHSSFLDIDFYTSGDGAIAASERANLQLILHFMQAFLDYTLLGGSSLNFETDSSRKIEIVRFEK